MGRISLSLPPSQNMIASAVFLFLLSLGIFNRTQNLWAWKLSLVSTEYGHLFAMVCVCLLIILFAKVIAVTPKQKLSAIFLVPAILLFSVPSFQYEWHRKSWNAILMSGFEPLTKVRSQSKDAEGAWVPHLHLTQLFSVATLLTPQVIEYSPEQHLTFNFYSVPEANQVHAKHAPFVVVVHGGGWDGGDANQMAEFSTALAREGFPVASIEYRLAPKHIWPAQKEDALEAIRYLKSHADTLGLDANQFAILGRSAGGQIAEAVAFSLPDLALKACIAFYAPSDMNFSYQFGYEDDVLKSPSLLRNFLGGPPTGHEANYTDASPLHFVNAQSPPTLLFHGPHDPLVWYKQSERLQAALETARVPHALITLPWATHGFEYNRNGPGGQLSFEATTALLRKVFE